MFSNQIVVDCTFVVMFILKFFFMCQVFIALWRDILVLLAELLGEVRGQCQQRNGISRAAVKGFHEATYVIMYSMSGWLCRHQFLGHKRHMKAWNLWWYKPSCVRSYLQLQRSEESGSPSSWQGCCFCCCCWWQEMWRQQPQMSSFLLSQESDTSMAVQYEKNTLYKYTHVTISMYHHPGK